MCRLGMMTYDFFSFSLFYPRKENKRQHSIPWSFDVPKLRVSSIQFLLENWLYHVALIHLSCLPLICWAS